MKEIADIELSELIVAEIIAKLALQGLRRQALSKFDLSKNLIEKTDNALFDDVIHWLVTEGIIWVSEEIPDSDVPDLFYYQGACLSAYGFSILQQPSPFSEKGELFGKSVEQVRSSGQNYSRAGELVGGLLAGFTKSMSS